MYYSGKHYEFWLTKSGQLDLMTRTQPAVLTFEDCKMIGDCEYEGLKYPAYDGSRRETFTVDTDIKTRYRGTDRRETPKKSSN